jgi:hypothetical protein
MFQMRKKIHLGDGLRRPGEKFGEVMNQARFYFVERYIAVEELFEGGGLSVGDAAGNDEVEVAEVCGDIEGETVGGDPAADVDADGGEFFFWDIARRLHPDTGLARDSKSGDAKIGGGADHGFFERANVPVNITADEIEIENGITDDLAGAVIGDVAAAVGFAKFDIFLAQDIFGSEKIFLAGVAAKREDVGMLAEEENVVDGAGFTRGDDSLLKGVGVGPGEEAEVGDEERVHSRRS